MTDKKNIANDPFLDIQNTSFYKALLDDLVTFVAVLDKTGTIIFVNNTPLIAAGITLEEVKGIKFWDAAWWAYSDDALRSIREDVKLCATGESLIHEIQVATSDGSLMWIEYSMHPIFNEQGEVQYLVPEGRDITEQKEQEELLRRSQKMDALGKLTGGIAHDYNNVLGVIHGFAELLSHSLVNDPKLTKFVDNIIQSAERGSKLTRKLLAITHKKYSEIKTVNLNNCLTEQQLLLERTLTAKITIHYDLMDELWLTDIDENDFEDSLLNIAINAMQAMESGGQLSVQTSNEYFNKKEAKLLRLKEGAYIKLSIADSGCGMNEETIEEIFDPFYSTKGDQGIGLGMSQVLDFMQRSKGAIKVFSQPDKGSRIVLYFPRSAQKIDASSLALVNNSNLNGDETILVVDGESAMLEYAYEMISSYGYHVLTASKANEALLVLEKKSVDVVIIDVTMSGDGYQLAAKIKQTYPSTKVQIVSEFSDDRYVDSAPIGLRKNILYKPYTSKSLLAHIRDLIGISHTQESERKKTILFMDDDEAICQLYEIQSEKLGYQSIILNTTKSTILCFKDAINNDEFIDIIVLDLNMSEEKTGVDVAAEILKIKPSAKIFLASGDQDDERMMDFSNYGFIGVLKKPCNIKTMKQKFNAILSKNAV